MARKIGSVYLASPEGFASGHRTYLEAVKKHLREVCKVKVWDPWEQDYSDELKNVGAHLMLHEVRQMNLAISMKIGWRNMRGIESCDAVLGICEGAMIDDGTASEMGFGAGKGKSVFGLRTDFRDVGDLLGVPINLQVLFWIDLGDGKLFRKIEDIVLP